MALSQTHNIDLLPKIPSHKLPGSKVKVPDLHANSSSTLSLIQVDPCLPRIKEKIPTHISF